MVRATRAACLFVAALAFTGVAFAQPGTIGPATPGPSPSPPVSAVTPMAAPQGVAVIGLGGARNEAFSLARAVYASRLRPAGLDEVRARVLAGDPPPPNAARELRELAEVRASVAGDDAVGRRLLAGIGRQIGVEALLVVARETRETRETPETQEKKKEPNEAEGTDAGLDGGSGEAGAAPEVAGPSARLFLVEPGEFDAARYVPEAGVEGAGAWKSTVTSLERRFPSASRPVAAPVLAPKPATVRPEKEKSRPFYASGWFWGALGAAAILGAAFYFGSQDTSADSIHLQMRVPK